MIIEDSKNQLTIKEIESVELRLGFSLPIDFRNFLLKHNGGVPIPNIFTFRDTLGSESNSLVDFFHAIYEGDENDNLEIEYNFYNNSKRIPPNLLPIAHDPLGNLICISVDGEDKGNVYFWDHELEPLEPSYDNLSIIAENFSEFLKNLKEL